MLLLMALLYVACGLLFIGLAIPLIQRRVPPNPWYGFRVAKTMNNPDVWYPANQHSGWGLLAVGALTVVAAVAAALVLARAPSPSVGLYVAICTAVLLGSLLVTLVLSFRYLRTLP
jgi:hypothetical protein